MWRWLQCLLTTRYGGKATGFYKPCFEKKKIGKFYCHTPGGMLLGGKSGDLYERHVGDTPRIFFWY